MARTQPKVDTRLAKFVEDRRKELGLTPSAFVAATGLSQPGLDPLRKGLIKRYQERTTGPVCRVLKWTPDSIDAILAGGYPTTIDDKGAPLDSGPLPSEIVERLVSAEQALAELRTVVRELIDRMGGIRPAGNPRVPKEPPSGTES